MRRCASRIRGGVNLSGIVVDSYFRSFVSYRMYFFILFHSFRHSPLASKVSFVISRMPDRFTS